MLCKSLAGVVGLFIADATVEGEAPFLALNNCLMLLVLFKVGLQCFHTVGVITAKTAGEAVDDQSWRNIGPQRRL